MALPLNIVRKIYEGMFEVRTKLMYNVRKHYFVGGNTMLINGTKVTWDTITRDQLKYLSSNMNLPDSAIAQEFDITISRVRHKRKKFKLTMMDLIHEKFENEDERLFNLLNESTQDWFLDNTNIDLLSKAITKYIFRDGPIEDLHAKKGITQEDMKELNIFMVNRIAGLLKYAMDGRWTKLMLALSVFSMGTSEWYPAEPATEEIEIAYKLATEFGMGGK